VEIEFRERISIFYNRQYDLKSQLEGIDEPTDAIISGSLYASFDINTCYGKVNLRLFSQDFYYTLQLIKKGLLKDKI